METAADRKNTITLFDRARSQLWALLFNTVTTLSCVLLPAMNKSCTNGGDTVATTGTQPPPLAVLTPTVWSLQAFSKHR